jgi:hypothetical protein
MLYAEVCDSVVMFDKLKYIMPHLSLSMSA